MTRERHRQQNGVIWCTLDVWALRVTVILEPPSSPNLDGEAGSWHGDRCTIYISWSLPHEMAEATLIHELGHAGIETAGTGLATTGVKDRVVSDGEEQAVNLIAAVIYGTLKQNKMLQFPARPLTPYDRRKGAKA